MKLRENPSHYESRYTKPILTSEESKILEMVYHFPIVY